MTRTSIVYTGKLHCQLTHELSGSQIETDAPKDNQGQGEKFSPTDLVGAALGSCILTTIAMVAERDGIILENHARAEVIKEMTPQPTRRIGALRVIIYLPALIPLDKRAKLETAGHTCPVHRSLHPDVEAPIHYIYD